MALLDLADNSWMPMIIVGIVLVVGALLFLSMRGHINKVDVPADHDGESTP